MSQHKRVLAFLLCCAVLVAGAPASANWLTHIVREAGEAGAKGAAHIHPNLGAVGKAAAHLKSLPDAPKGALAAHATPEGHWKFVNKEGDVFTAANADEMNRAFTSLAPESAAADRKLTLFLSEDSVFANRQSLDKLPIEADLHLVTNHGAFPILRTGEALKIRYKPNVTIDLADEGLLQESLAYLGRPLNKSGIRTIALEPGTLNTLPSAPKFESSTKVALVDKLDPAHISRAFGSIRGQTAVITGRIENGKLHIKPQSGGELSRDLDELLTAARENDVNLVLLNAGNPLQPGGKNWLWQSIEVRGYSGAIAQKTFGDFIEALAAKRSPMSIAASREGLGRVRLSATPTEGGSIVEPAASIFGEFLEHVTGEVATRTIEIETRDEGRQMELDARIIPFIPTYIQIPYLIGIVCGLIGWPVARPWWRRIWPPRVRATGESRASHLFGNLPNVLAYTFLFLPVAGGPAMFWLVLLQTWATVSAPFRWIGRLFRRKVEI